MPTLRGDCHKGFDSISTVYCSCHSKKNLVVRCCETSLRCPLMEVYVHLFSASGLSTSPITILLGLAFPISPPDFICVRLAIRNPAISYSTLTLSPTLWVPCRHYGFPSRTNYELPISSRSKSPTDFGIIWSDPMLTRLTSLGQNPLRAATWQPGSSVAHLLSRSTLLF